IHVKLTDEAVARGEYLANHVMLCMDCHAQRDWTVFAGPPKPGTLGAGGERFDEMMGFPGKFISPNITPTKLEDWSDGEI
ncbi:MAG: cytochrome C, partial [Luteibaculum sp.]